MTFCSNELVPLCVPPFHDAFQINIQGRMLYTKTGNLRLFTKSRGEISPTFINKQKVGNKGDCVMQRTGSTFPL